MYQTTGRLLLPLAAVSMMSLPSCTRAFVVRTRPVCAALAGRATSTSSRHPPRRARSSPRMELAVDITAVAEVAEKTPANKLLYAPPKFTPTPYEYLEELTVRIESLTNLGEGIAREGETGWVVMVPHVIPGELVKCKVFRNHANYSEATLVSVEEPSPDRVEPNCPLFGMCGGCQYQHMSVSMQRDWKKQQVMDCLTRIGGMVDPAVKDTLGTDETYGYRSKLTPHYDAPYQGRVREIGFKKVKFPTIYHGVDLGNVNPSKVVDVERCPLATEGINEALPPARQEARERVQAAFDSGDGKRVGKRGATLLFRETTEEGTVTDNNAHVSERVGGMVFNFKAGEFFQNNPYVLPHMVDYVVARAKEGGAKNLIDAYCGGGLFCLSASTSFEKCAGIEISPMAVDCATRNAAANDISNCLFLAGTASNIFANVSFTPSETVVIVDPPRKGCDQLFLGQLFKFRPTRLVYVSCDPATQARDAKEIMANGYEAVDIQPFDLFPQTRHIENVITFQDTRKRD
ncbi:unnamed protein product [Ectocarpus sp. 6 AP-2014]